MDPCREDAHDQPPDAPFWRRPLMATEEQVEVEIVVWFVAIACPLAMWLGGLTVLLCGR